MTEIDDKCGCCGRTGRVIGDGDGLDFMQEMSSEDGDDDDTRH